MKVCAVIPAHNEAGTVGEIVRRASLFVGKVVVVDDGSTDGTGEEASRAGARVVRNGVNMGKGVALRRGFAEVLKCDFDFAVTLDADEQHAPEEIPRLLERASSGGFDLVGGSRMENLRPMPIVRRWTNRLMSLLVSMLAGTNLRDTQCGFRLISRRLLEGVSLKETRFNIESELVTRAARKGFRISEIPVETIYGPQKSKIAPVLDTLRFFRFILEFM